MTSSQRRIRLKNTPPECRNPGHTYASLSYNIPRLVGILNLCATRLNELLQMDTEWYYSSRTSRQEQRNQNTRHTLLRLHSVCRAHFQPGTIPNTSQHQYNGPPGLMTPNGHFWSVGYNGCVECPRHRTTRTGWNSNKRQVSLW